MINASAETLAIAGAFAAAIARDHGFPSLRLIDELNSTEADLSICHSHDVCDANFYMDAALEEVTGVALSDHLPNVPDALDAKWHHAWAITKKIGFANTAQLHRP